MKSRKLVAGAAGMALAVGVTGVAVAANTAAAPRSVTVAQKGGIAMKPNRYVKDLLRFNQDIYTVKTGGTVNFKFTVNNEGPHTLSIVRPKDLPTTGAQMEKCAICKKLGEAHGADPNSDAPPKFLFLENGVGENDAPPKLDRPGDSSLSGEKRNSVVKLKVTAKAGKTLSFMCLIHPWMQAKLRVVK